MRWKTTKTTKANDNEMKLTVVEIRDREVSGRELKRILYAARQRRTKKVVHTFSFTNPGHKEIFAGNKYRIQKFDSKYLYYEINDVLWPESFKSSWNDICNSDFVYTIKERRYFGFSKPKNTKGIPIVITHQYNMMFPSCYRYIGDENYD